MIQYNIIYIVSTIYYYTMLNTLNGYVKKTIGLFILDQVLIESMTLCRRKA